MCGIAGFTSLGHNARLPDTAAADLRAMCHELAHRGPDAEDIWLDDTASVALGHRRLSVVDLSSAGAQPMHSASGRYVITYNGEIYGHAALADELAQAGAAFRGHSDTEVLLAAIEAWGLQAALERINGMFAFALWDRHERTLSLVRDRAGKKPLYIARTSHGLAFASEMAALMALPGFERRVSRDSLALYLRYYAVPAPHTIFAGAWKLPPAACLTIDTANPPDDIATAIAAAHRYWDIAAVAEEGERGARAAPLSDGEALAHLEDVFGTAVEERLVADVPVGAFLSGGVDSSCVVAMMRERATGPVETFTVGFDEAGYDEADHARKVARHLGTHHHEVYVSGSEARDVIPRLPEIYSEPFADSSQIPTYLISRFARSRVTVALSGDGGDESFGGYNRHIYGPRLAAAAGHLPGPLKGAFASLARSLPPSSWDRLLAPLGQPQAGDRLYKLADAAEAADAADLYMRFQSIWRDPAGPVPGAREPELAYPRPKLSGLAAEMMLGDFMHYLPTDPLHKVDRASMAVSLEVRCPFLDRRVVESAWRLPESTKIRAGSGKWILRELLAKRLPREIMERPKQGFGVPIGDWLRGPLRGWAEDLLAEEKLKADGLFEAAPIRSAWARHIEGRENLGARLWTVLMFQAWRERWI